MAHPCFNCGSECYCHGDIDDAIVCKTPKDCDGCGCVEADYYFNQFDDDDEDDLVVIAESCTCGAYYMDKDGKWQQTSDCIC